MAAVYFHADAFIEANLVSTFGQLLIGGKSTVEIIIFLAGNKTEISELGKELLGFGRFTQHEIGLSKMLMRAAVSWIQHQRALIVAYRRTKVAQAPIAITDVVLDIGIEGVLQRCDFERRDCA